jgi:hypothetical protein
VWRLMALKRPTVAPAKGLLTEAVLDPGCLDAAGAGCGHGLILLRRKGQCSRPGPCTNSALWCATLLQMTPSV